MKTKYFATFGQAHGFRNKVVCILAPSRTHAHSAMHEIFGKNWAFLYEFHDPQDGYTAQAAEFRYEIMACVEVCVDQHTKRMYLEPINEDQFV